MKTPTTPLEHCNDRLPSSKKTQVSTVKQNFGVSDSLRQNEVDSLLLSEATTALPPRERLTRGRFEDENSLASTR